MRIQMRWVIFTVQLLDTKRPIDQTTVLDPELSQIARGINNCTSTERKCTRPFTLFDPPHSDEICHFACGLDRVKRARERETVSTSNVHFLDRRFIEQPLKPAPQQVVVSHNYSSNYGGYSSSTSNKNTSHSHNSSSTHNYNSSNRNYNSSSSTSAYNSTNSTAKVSGALVRDNNNATPRRILSAPNNRRSFFKNVKESSSDKKSLKKYGTKMNSSTGSPSRSRSTTRELIRKSYFGSIIFVLFLF